MPVLRYTKNDEDLKFILYCLDQNATLERSTALSLDGEENLDAIIERIFGIASEESSSKRIAEFKRLRKTPAVPKSELCVLNLLSYIGIVRDLLLTGSLKNKEAIDEFTKFLIAKGVKFDPEFCMAEIRAGKIVSIEEAVGLEKLYAEHVEANREYFICSGLRGVYKKTDLAGNTYLFLLNIKKVSFKGLESEGMICCAEGDLPEALKVDATVGCRVRLTGHLDMFEDLEYGKIDMKKETFKRVFSQFKIVNHTLCFKGIGVEINGQPVKCQTESGNVR